MKFLFVLRENELVWGSMLKSDIENVGGEVITETSTEEAIKLLKDPNFKVDEIITGVLGDGNIMKNPWRDVQKAAAERGMGVTLLTGALLDSSQRSEFANQNVLLLEKGSFKLSQFLSERFPAGGPKET